MDRVPYPLLAVVQDLQELLQRYAPSGPFRHTLFHDPAAMELGWPLVLQQAGPPVEQLLRAVACLLANGFAAAAPVVLRAALPLLRDLDERLNGRLAAGVAEYYRLLTVELQVAPQPWAWHSYWLCGECLALYLDLLCTARPALQAELGERVSTLRRSLHEQRQLLQAGE